MSKFIELYVYNTHVHHCDKVSDNASSRRWDLSQLVLLRCQSITLERHDDDAVALYMAAEQVAAASHMTVEHAQILR